MLSDGSAENLNKKKGSHFAWKEKWKKYWVVSVISPIPAALFLVDIGHEHIALAEAKRLGISTIGMVDTNCDPQQSWFRNSTANDDATKSIAIIVNYITAAIAEGLQNMRLIKKKKISLQMQTKQSSSKT